MKGKLIYSSAPQKDQIMNLTKFCPQKFFDQSTLPFFSSEVVKFLSDLSNLILNKKNIKPYPELIALAFWIRKGNIVKILEKWKEKLSINEIAYARGVAFHVAPSNVDSIFIYSFALSLLVGNSNLVRITNKRSKQLDIIFEFIQILYKKYPTIADRNKFFTYEHDEEISNYFSVNADLRIIWGGDNTVNLIKSLKSKATVKDVTFSDKSSLSIIDTKSYLNLDNLAKIKLAHLFFNDSYWFDQKACSSPTRLYFIGDEFEKASNYFWSYLGKELIKNNALDDVSLSIKKITALYTEILNNDNLQPLIYGKHDMPTVILQKKISPISQNCGGGFFIEGRLSNLKDLSKVINFKDQTLSYFGLNKTLIKDLFNNNNILGIDRIVPIGNALNFSPIWDGYDLITEFTKRLTIS